MSTDIEARLRAMLQERATDIALLPAVLTRFGDHHDPDDHGERSAAEMLDVGPSRRHRRRTRWLAAAAAAVIVAIAGTVVGLRHADDQPVRPVAPQPGTPTSFGSVTGSATPSSPATPSPTATASVTTACSASLPSAWRAATTATGSDLGAPWGASPLSVSATGDIVAQRDFGPGQPRDLVIIAPGRSPVSVFQVLDPQDLNVQVAYLDGDWLVVGVGMHGRAPKGVVPGDSPMPNVTALYVVNLRTGTRKEIAQVDPTKALNGGRTIDTAAVVGDTVYWDVRPSYGDDRGVIKSYALATGELRTVYSGANANFVVSAAGIVAGSTVVVRESLPKQVRDALSPTYPLNVHVQTDGTSYAWLLGSDEIGWWTPGRAQPIRVRIRKPIQVSTYPDQIMVSGPFVVVDNSELIDVRTGASAEIGLAPKRVPAVLAGGGVVVGVDDTGDGRWVDGYWQEPVERIFSYTTTSLPDLHC